jgi:hypothetical protein
LQNLNWTKQLYFCHTSKFRETIRTRYETGNTRIMVLIYLTDTRTGVDYSQ